MNISRRELFVKLTQSVAYVAVLASLPKLAWAKWNKKAFVAPNLDAAIEAKYGAMPLVDSDQVKLKAPAIAENGAVVPVTVSSSMEGVKSVSLLVRDNPSPLVTTFHFSESSIVEVSARIRMSKTSNVIALAEVNGKLYRAEQEVKVTIGGCGG